MSHIWMLAIAVGAVLARSQTFEVASVRPSAMSAAGGEGSARSRIEYSPNSLTARNVGLQECIQWAYGVAFYQVTGPVPSESYDIRAKAEKPVPVSELRLMLQDLLAKRFSLQIHRETKMLPVYELVVAKHGPRLPTPKAENEILHAAENLPRIENDSFVFYDASLSDFAAMLHQLRGVDRPVCDRTGIKGIFDIVLKSAPSATRQGDGPLLFTLIEEQLGLKLVATKGPVEMIVIEHAEKPSGN